jgi:hypothetical protein
MFITFGMWLLPAGVRKMVRGMMVFHVPEGLTDDERLEVIRAKDAWDRSKQVLPSAPVSAPMPPVRPTRGARPIK